MKINARICAALTALLGMFMLCVPAFADTPVITNGATLTAASAPLVLSPLTGQSSCVVETSASTGLTLTYQTLIQNAWVPTAGTSYDQTVVNVTTSTTTGTLTFPCGGASAFRVVPSGSGTATVFEQANGGISKVIGAGVNGGKTTVAGSGPVTVTNSGSTATVGLTDPLPILYGGTGATALPTGCVESNGTALFTLACPSSAPAASVQAGTGIAVATPSPGVFVVSNTGVTSVTGTSSITVTAGATPVVSLTNTLTPNNCLQSNSSGIIVDGASGGANTQIGVAGVSGGLTGYGFTITTPLPFNIPALSTLKTVNTSTGGGYYLFNPSSYASGYTGAIGLLAFASFGTTDTSAEPLYAAGPAVSNTTLLTGSPSNTAQTGNFGTYTYTLPAASTVALGTNVMYRFYNSANNYGFYATLNAPLAIGGTSINYTVQSAFGAPPATINNVLIQSINAGTAECVNSVISGSSNVTITQPSPNVYAIAVATQSPSPGSTPVSIQAGANVTVATPSPGVFVITAATAAPATINAGTGISVATPSANTYTITNTGVTAVNVGSNLTSTGGTTPTIALTAAPGVTNLSVSTLTSGNCVQASTGGQLVSAAAACGNGTGTVTSVTATGNIQSSGGTTPVISMVSSPTFLHTTTIGTSGSAATPNNAYIVLGTGSGVLNFTNVTSGSSVSGVTGTELQLNANGPNFLAMDASGNLGIAGTLYAPGLADSGLTVGNCVQATTSGQLTSASGACGTGTVTGLTAGSNILVGTGTTPSVAVTAAPTFSNITDSALTSGNCLQAGVSGLLSTATTACRTKQTLNLFIGFAGGTVNTSTVYLYQQVAGYTSANISKLRAACAGADNGTTVFTVTDVTAATSIGTISMANAATTATTTLGAAYALTAGHVFTMTVTTAGTAVSCGVTAEGTANLQ